MKIDYSLYFNNNFVFPVITAVCLTIFAALNIYQIFKNIHTKTFGFNIIFLVVIIAVIFFTTYPLRQGIFLISEKENDAVVTCGEVTDIEFASFSPRYYLNGARKAVWICIGDEKYYCVDNNDITIGDTVSLTYLPKSRCVIEYVKEEHCENTEDK